MEFESSFGRQEVKRRNKAKNATSGYVFKYTCSVFLLLAEGSSRNQVIFLLCASAAQLVCLE